MEKKKPFYKNKKQPKRFDKNQELKDEVVYKTKDENKGQLADWQLKLKAIGICMSNTKGHIINDEVEKIYQDLKHRVK